MNAERRVFNIQSLHAAIIATWGAHGAHNDVFWSMLNEIDELRSVVRACCPDLDTLSPAQASAVKRAREDGYGMGRFEMNDAAAAADDATWD